MFYAESSGHYSPLTSDSEDNLESKTSQRRISGEKSRFRRNLLFLIIIALVCLSAGFFSGTVLEKRIADRQISRTEEVSTCDKSRFRREWRSLSYSEKCDYIEAVKCLKQTPSRLGLNQSLYDDFPYVHFRVGGYSHGSAAFLAWHRYFLYTYHQALQQQCHFAGELVYWDWTLDWQNMTTSPIWDPDIGFGGNGDPDIGDSIVEGHCVGDGPFANFEIPFLDAEYRPHCLSRGFESGDELAEHGRWFSPAASEALLQVDDYETFNLGLEDGPHIAIPRSIRGDFSLLTAPSDPVFFLHHGQLDRLWWIWQSIDDRKRGKMYNGKALHNATKDASLDDTIPMGGLAPDIRVRDVIDPQDGLLCYRYH